MAERIASRNVLWPFGPQDITSPKEALEAAFKMAARLETHRQVGVISPQDAYTLMDLNGFGTFDEGRRQHVDALKKLRFGDLHIEDPELRVQGTEIHQAGEVLLKPRNSLQILCGCGCRASVSAITLQRRVPDTRMESLYHAPLDEFEQYHEQGTLTTPYICPHVSLLLEKWFPQVLTMWRDIRQRIYNTKLRGRIENSRMSGMEFNPEWFRKDIGLLTCIADVGPPKTEGGWDDMATSKLTKFKQRGKYLGEHFYWRGEGEPEKDGLRKLPSQGADASTLQRIVYTRFYAAKHRAEELNIEFGWERWSDFWQEITSEACLPNAKLPADFAPGAYQLRFEQGGRKVDRASGKVGMCSQTMYWAPTAKHAMMQPVETAATRGAKSTKVLSAESLVHVLEAIEAQDGQPGLFSLFKVVGGALGLKHTPVLSTVPEKAGPQKEEVSVAPKEVPLQTHSLGPKGLTDEQRQNSLREELEWSEGFVKELEAKVEAARLHFETAKAEDKDAACDAWDKVAEELQERSDMTEELRKRVVRARPERPAVAETKARKSAA